jgi:hypothetical protein
MLLDSPAPVVEPVDFVLARAAVGVGETTNSEAVLRRASKEYSVFTHADVFDLYKKSGEAKNVEHRVNYISQMHNTEFYVLARAEITRIEDLAGK